MSMQQPRNLLCSVSLCALLGTSALMLPGTASACGTEPCDPPPPAARDDLHQHQEGSQPGRDEALV